ncbi:hypothetical protein D0T87_01605 [Bacteroides sp. 51]|nr:hypothetical protein [Bacteroides sp. 51]
MFLSFHKYVNYYKRGKIVLKKICTPLTFIIYFVPKMAFLTVFLAGFTLLLLQSEYGVTEDIPF